VWTPDAYDAHTTATLAGRDPLDPDVRELRRFYSMNAWDTELDSAGRVGIPAPLIKHANLKKDVVVTGAGECLEVWDRDTGAAYNEELVARVSDITSRLARPA
jgi:MraZ protein